MPLFRNGTSIENKISTLWVKVIYFLKIILQLSTETDRHMNQKRKKRLRNDRIKISVTAKKDNSG
jgi:hypothetical protein